MMRTKWSLLAVLLLLISHWALAQKKLVISASAAPGIGSTNYRARYFYPESDGQIVEPVFLDGRRISWAYMAGVSVQYTYEPGWSVSSGIWFHQSSTQQSRQPMAGEGTVTLRSRALRVPLVLNYKPSGDRLSAYFSFGLLTDFPITSRVVVDRVGESTQYLRLRPLVSRPTFHGLLGAGVHYQLTSRYVVVAQPTFTYSFGQLGGASSHNPSFTLFLQTQIGYTF